MLLKENLEIHFARHTDHNATPLQRLIGRRYREDNRVLFLKSYAIWEESKSKLLYDWRSVGQYVLVSSPL
jgi:hypothetical protein